MSKYFTATNRKTGDDWKPHKHGAYLVMYDSGNLAEVGPSDFYGTHISPLDPKEWKVKIKPSFLGRIERLMSKNSEQNS